MHFYTLSSLTVLLLLRLSQVSLLKYNNGNKDYKIVCYYDVTAVLRPSPSNFSPEMINTNLCTHLMYAFANVSETYELVSAYPDLDLHPDSNLPTALNLYKRTTNLKRNNHNLKVILSVGGWEFGSVLFSQMSKTSDSRKVFINSCLNLLRQYNFDGLDLDWEYPAARNGTPEDKVNFLHLVQELRKAFDNEYLSEQKSKLLLSVAVSADKNTSEMAYDPSALAKNVDFINLMTFDYYVVDDGYNTTNLHNALYKRKTDRFRKSRLNINWTVNYWKSFSIPPKKLLLAIPFYGRSYMLAFPNVTGVGSPAFVSGGPGPYTKSQEGMYAFYEICLFLKRRPSSWTTVIDPETRTPYSHNHSYWIGYDNEKSIEEKMEYVKQFHLGGVMIWSIDQDDFLNICNEEKVFPLLQTINEVLNFRRPGVY